MNVFEQLRLYPFVIDYNQQNSIRLDGWSVSYRILSLVQTQESLLAHLIAIRFVDDLFTGE